MITKAFEALTRIEKKLEKCDKLFEHSDERNDIKIIVDCLLECKKYKYIYKDLCK